MKARIHFILATLSLLAVCSGLLGLTLTAVLSVSAGGESGIRATVIQNETSRRGSFFDNCGNVPRNTDGGNQNQEEGT